jgi:hypothetical protein
MTGIISHRQMHVQLGTASDRNQLDQIRDKKYQLNHFIIDHIITAAHTSSASAR